MGKVKVPFHQNFEEINLRCYVKRFDGQTWRHGTVFIQEIADKTILSALANSLLHENYRIIPTKQEVSEEVDSLKVKYFWQLEEEWQHLMIKADSVPYPMAPDSETEFIIHRLWGYGKHSEKGTHEYDIAHPHWFVYKVKDFNIKVDFTKVFGPEFSLLSNATPHSIILAEGSNVRIQDKNTIMGNK